MNKDNLRLGAPLGTADFFDTKFVQEQVFHRKAKTPGRNFIWMSFIWKNPFTNLDFLTLSLE